MNMLHLSALPGEIEIFLFCYLPLQNLTIFDVEMFVSCEILHIKLIILRKSGSLQATFYNRHQHLTPAEVNSTTSVTTNLINSLTLITNEFTCRFLPFILK